MQQKRKGFAILLIVSSFSTLYLMELANTAFISVNSVWGSDFLQVLGVFGLIISTISFIGFVATFFFMEEETK